MPPAAPVTSTALISDGNGQRVEERVGVGCDRDRLRELVEQAGRLEPVAAHEQDDPVVARRPRRA